MINEVTASEICHELTATTQLGAPVRREPIRIWQLSGVERLHLCGGRTVVFKYASSPFTTEDHLLRFAESHGVPVSALYASTVRDGVLGMILEDLGAPDRDATDATAAEAAARLHITGPMPDAPTLGRAELQNLPSTARANLAKLQAECRFPNVDDIRQALTTLERIAGRRAIGAEQPPFGFCHGELHPTSLHIGSTGWRLVDFAKAHNGPGLLDLATWHGTRLPPNLPRMRRLITAYIAAGGPVTARGHRGGVPPENWALGWHRIHAAAWYLKQAAHNINDPTTDPACIPVIRRQLTSAVRLLTQAGNSLPLP